MQNTEIKDDSIESENLLIGNSEPNDSEGVVNFEGSSSTNLDDLSDLEAYSTNKRYTVEFENETIYFDSIDWRDSTLLKLQIIAGYLVFILFGLAEQTVGTLIPKFQDHYEIDDIQTSFIFLASVAGYFLMALLNEITHKNLGIRGVVILGSVSMTCAYLIVSFKPPFSIFIFCYILNGIGFGSLDASLNTWMGCLIDSNQLLGILHGCYGIGCMISPPVITGLLERAKNPWQWNKYYMVLSSVGALNTIFLILAFRHETSKKYKFAMILKNKKGKKLDEENEFELDTFRNQSEVSTTNDELDNEKEDHSSVPLSEALKSKLVWLFSIILFIYVGGEVSFGSWLITFLTRIKSLSYTYSSYMATSFWAGLTAGRIGLGFVTAHYFKNELVANFLYMFLSFAGFLAFWMLSWVTTNFFLFIIVFLAGAFVGPIFPTTIVASLKILPHKYHAAGLGFICAFGGGGAAALPFLIGIIAESSTLGLTLLPCIVMSIFAFLCLMWLGMMKRYGANYNTNRL